MNSQKTSPEHFSTTLGRYLTYDPGHNVLVIYCVSETVWLATIKTAFDINYNRLPIWFVSLVAERIET